MLVDFLHFNSVKKRQENPKTEGEIDPKFWEVLLSAQKKDYEKICRSYGITDFRWMLKRLNQMKKQIEDEQAKVFRASHIRTVNSEMAVLFTYFGLCLKGG